MNLSFPSTRLQFGAVHRERPAGDALAFRLREEDAGKAPLCAYVTGEDRVELQPKSTRYTETLRKYDVAKEAFLKEVGPQLGLNEDAIANILDESMAVNNDADIEFWKTTDAALIEEYPTAQSWVAFKDAVAAFNEARTSYRESVARFAQKLQ